jgi:two-component system NtrC family sensor kinase
VTEINVNNFLQGESAVRPRILLVEDDHSQARLLQLIFERSDLAAELTVKHTLVEARDALDESNFDLVITDLNLPDGRGTELLPSDPANAAQPTILLTGQGDQEVAVQAIKSGAFDYIVKSEDTIRALPDTAQKVLREWGNLLLRRQMEDALRQKQAELARQHKQLQNLFKTISTGKREWELTFDCVNELIIQVDAQGRIRRANRAVMELMGVDYPGLSKMKIAEIFGDLPLLEEEFRGVEFCHLASGRVFLLSSYRLSESEIAPGMVITAHDYTAISELNDRLAKSNSELERKREELEQAYDDLKQTQEQVLRQEKMATVGQLAAGVAHEINNPMGFILSNLGTLGRYLAKLKRYIEAQDQLIDESSDETLPAKTGEVKRALNIDYVLSDLADLISESSDGAERVRKIVADLKGFSHQTEEHDQLTDINKLIEDIIPIVWNEIKYKATLQKDYGQVTKVLCRPRLLGQVIINLLVNAVQSIEKQGVITLATAQSGDCVLISIADDGCGIPEDIVKRIFDPFFTTKEVGVGTGLGLSISYDIIKQHGGDMRVSSVPQRGTTFTISLPAAKSGATNAKDPGEAIPGQKGAGASHGSE